MVSVVGGWSSVVGVTMGDMDDPDAQLQPPAECVVWCRAQDYALIVGDDIAPVDLDWWNTALADHKIGVRLWGRDLDGRPVDSGAAFLRRDDLPTGVLPDAGPRELGVLYRAAAWLAGHPRRPRAKRFIDVRTPVAGHELNTILSGLRLCTDQHILGGGRGDCAPWPATPGVGSALLSLYCWAALPEVVERPQLLDQNSLSTLCRLGWLQTPSLPGFTHRGYLRHCQLLHCWAGQVGVPAELIEMWLSSNWSERIRVAGQHISTDGG